MKPLVRNLQDKVKYFARYFGPILRTSEQVLSYKQDNSKTLSSFDFETLRHCEQLFNTQFFDQILHSDRSDKAEYVLHIIECYAFNVPGPLSHSNNLHGFFDRSNSRLIR